MGRHSETSALVSLSEIFGYHSGLEPLIREHPLRRNQPSTLGVIFRPDRFDPGGNGPPEQIRRLLRLRSVIDQHTVEQSIAFLTGFGKSVQQGFRFLKPKTCIGDALTVGYGCSLPPRHKVALDHQRPNR